MKLPGTVTERELTGFARTAPTRSTVWAPDTSSEIEKHLRDPFDRGIVARGLGRSYGDAAQNAGGHVLDATALDRIIDLDLDQGLVTCEPGVSLATLMQVLIPLGWFPMVIPGTRFVTVGGAIASDIHGKFRLGSFADFVESATLVTPTGEVLTVGADADDAGRDAWWATAGGMGLTGVVSRATLRLHRIETAWMQVDTERCVDVDDCMARMLAADDRYRYSVAWIDTMAKGAALGRAVLERGDHARLDSLDAKHSRRARDYAPRVSIEMPQWMPNGLINGLSIKAFNELWFRRAPREHRDEVRSIVGFFHPLDAVLGWNRVYGSRGLLQYQFVVPYGAERVVRVALERFAAAGAPSFLAVLKRFESGNDGYLSFPIPGWTLAVDFPTGVEGLAELLDDLDELVIEAGGRVYLAKDSRLPSARIASMYPRLDAWRDVQARLDPNGAMQSDLDRRLGLTRRPRTKRPPTESTPAKPKRRTTKKEPS
jgi:decaprenylphospho-beta-D-ribofuranose 2-oxidase